MFQFDIEICGLSFHVTTQYRACEIICKDYLIDTRGQYEITIDDADLALDREIIRNDKSVDDNMYLAPAPFVETISLLRKLADMITEHNRMLMHGSTIAIDGKGYIFTAVSGTGKSTHTALLRKLFGDRAVMINDDKPFVHVDGDKAYVSGTPWMGKHGLGQNICVPLCGIYFLHRSEENTLRKMTPEEALHPVIAQCHRPMDPVAMMNSLELIDKMLSIVPLYELGCNMDISAAELSSSVM